MSELKRVYYRLLRVAEGGKARTWRSVTGLALDGKPSGCGAMTVIIWLKVKKRGKEKWELKCAEVS